MQEYRETSFSQKDDILVIRRHSDNDKLIMAFQKKVV